MKFLVVMHGESTVVFAKMPVDALHKRSEGRGFVFFTIFLSHSKNKFFDDFLQFYGRNIFNFPFLVTGVKIFFENFDVVQGFLLRVFVFKFFCKLFNFFVADERKPARQAIILNNKRDARNQFNKSKRRES